MSRAVKSGKAVMKVGGVGRVLVLREIAWERDSRQAAFQGRTQIEARCIVTLGWESRRDAAESDYIRAV